MGGSRGGHMMAAVWSTLLHMGSDGYDKEARLVHRTFQKILKGIVPIEGYVVFERVLNNTGPTLNRYMGLQL